VTASRTTPRSDLANNLLRIKIKFGGQNESPSEQMPSRSRNVAPVPAQFTNTALPWSFTSDSPATGFGSSHCSRGVADAPQSSDCASSSKHAYRIKPITTPAAYYADHTRVNTVSKLSQAPVLINEPCPSAKSPATNVNLGLGCHTAATLANPLMLVITSLILPGDCQRGRRPTADAVHSTRPIIDD
jgi:hypothetical protein